MSNQMKVKVYMVWVNAWGEVTEKSKIAEFRNMAWAKAFIEQAKESVKADKSIQIVVEEK